jgi:hypothetical protein
VVRIGPEVVQELAAPLHPQDPGVGVEHLQRLSAHPFEPFTTEFGQRQVAVLTHPLQRPLTSDVLQPHERIIRADNMSIRACVGHRKRRFLAVSVTGSAP